MCHVLLSLIIIQLTVINSHKSVPIEPWWLTARHNTYLGLCDPHRREMVGLKNSLMYPPKGTDLTTYCMVKRTLCNWATSHCWWIGRKEMFYLMMESTHFIYGYMASDMVKDYSDSERGNPLPPHRLLFPISSKGSFICIIPQTG